MRILYSDRAIIVIEKSGGLLSVPGRGPDKQDCVVNRVRAEFPDCIVQPAVHRLDMYTSGLLILARTKEAHRHLSLQFEKRLPEKHYIALLDGPIQAHGGRIELKFRLDPDNRPHQIFDPHRGRCGITLWQKITEEYGKTRVLFLPQTGRTHQLRLHAAHPLGLNTPIVGDRLYGDGTEGQQMMLHASRLTVIHPIHEEPVTYTSTVPF